LPPLRSRVWASTVPKLCQILSLDHRCARIWQHFVGQAVHFLQGFSFHLELHLRILLEDFSVTLPRIFGEEKNTCAENPQRRTNIRKPKQKPVGRRKERHTPSPTVCH